MIIHAGASVRRSRHPWIRTHFRNSNEIQRWPARFAAGGPLAFYRDSAMRIIQSSTTDADVDVTYPTRSIKVRRTRLEMQDVRAAIYDVLTDDNPMTVRQ